MRYAAFETLIAPARASAQPLRLLAGSALVVALFVAMSAPYVALAAPLVAAAESRAPVVLLVLAQFALLIVALAVALGLVHRRGIASLLGPPRRAARQFLRVAAHVLPLYLLLLFIPMPAPYDPSANMAPGTWARWLPLGLVAVAIQVAAEELAFRGYLQSQLAARFSHPAVWIGVPSVLFGLVHQDPGQGMATGWPIVAWAMVFGALAADLTARAGTLGPAMALHLINNLFAMLVMAPAGDLDGLALYTVPLDLGAPGAAATILPIELGFTLCAWLAARLALRV
ncbi:MAG: hypothetical protein Kow0058_17770 [Roseovarius sp.]